MGIRNLTRAGGVLGAALLLLLGCGERGGNQAGRNATPPGDSAGAPASGAEGAEARGSDSAAADSAQRERMAARAQDSAAARDSAAERRRAEIQRAPRANPTREKRPPVSKEAATADSARARTDTDTGRTAAPPPLRDAYHQPPRDTVSQVVYDGWKYFNLNCARCHGEDVTGTTIAPHLIDSFRSGKVDKAEFDRVVHGSRAAKGMPNWTGIIDDAKLDAIYQYIKARSEGKVHPGRPALRQGA